jgi:glutamate/tyrosine decarboxylase-like PLP-dependent enzyme
MNIKYLRKQLDKCLAERRAIYAVVAIVGSTEQGACDPLKDIVEIRREVSKNAPRLTT